MIILSIDPGYERVGVAVLDCAEGVGKEKLLFSCCLKTSHEKEFSARLGEIGEELQKIIRQYSPGELAIEKLFFHKNKKTALKVSEAKGAIIETAVRNGLTVREYTPLQIKQAVTGHGTADKKQVEYMVRILIGVKEGKILDDEIDAIAVGLTHSASRNSL